jgi:N-acetylglucosamine kinase-like BadF-type ATPase
VILAFDGGNSKTDAALVDCDGAVLAHTRGPQSSPHRLGMDGCVDVLQTLVDDVGLGRRRATVAQVLLAGIDFPEDEEELRRQIAARGWADEIVVGNDTFAVLRAGTDRGWGVAITCGAGINCIGVAADGRHVRFPSLGDITGDWGGGFDVGMAGLSAAARSEDGRGPATRLERLVPEHFGETSARTVGLAIHNGSIPERSVVQLAPAVLRAAAGDAVAASIRDRLVEEILAFARASVTRLELVDEHVEVVVGGGLMRGADSELLGRIEAGLRRVGPQLVLRRASAPPIVGAALLGLDAVGAGPEAQARLRSELGAAVQRLEKLEVA